MDDQDIDFTAPTPSLPQHQDPLGMGASAAMESETQLPSGLPNQELVQVYKQAVSARIAGCASKRDVLEVEVDSLTECVGIASEMYQRHPIPDNAYMLSSLQNTKNSSLSQLEKMKDPKIMLSEIEDHIKAMFTNLIKSMVSEVDKTKKEFIRLHPESRSSIEDQFSRMITALAPETNKLYDGLHGSLKRTLGIKK